MKTEIKIGDTKVKVDTAVTLAQDNDIVWLSKVQAIQLRNFLNQLELGE